MRVLVTGGFGFIGAQIAAALLERGWRVTLLDNGWRGARARREPPGGQVETIEADIRDREAVEQAVARADIVVHLAAVQGTSNFYRIPHTVLDVNVHGVMNVLEACARVRPQRVFFASSSEVYGFPTVFPTPETAPLSVPDVGNPRFSYAVSKILGEIATINYAREFGFDYTIVRYHNVYGPAMGWDHVIPQFICRLVRGEEFTVQGDGYQTRAFCYLDDAVAGSVIALLEPAGANEIFNIGNPDAECTINELVDLLGRVAGKSVVPRHVAFSQEGVRRRLPDITRARERLGFEPKVPLGEGLQRTYAWYLAELGAGRGPGRKESL